jgi:hypothetical protein
MLLLKIKHEIKKRKKLFDGKLVKRKKSEKKLGG